MEESASAEIQEELNERMGKAKTVVLQSRPQKNLNENSGSEREASSSNGNKSQNGNVDRKANLLDRVLANNITEMLESSEPLLSDKCCFYRVPHDLRKLNEEAYTPQYVSIGPFHHGNERLETMEKLKVRYFKIFVEKTAQNMDDLVSYIRGREGDIRCCYAETSRLTSDDYVKMVLLDASFIIVFILISEMPRVWECHQEFTAFAERLLEDMWLLENQLPFFVIEELYKLAFASRSNYPSFTQLTFQFFEGYNNQELMFIGPNFKTMHFIDLLRTFFQPPSFFGPRPQSGPTSWARALRSFFMCLMMLKNSDKENLHFYTASQLHEAGVKFEVSSSKYLFELEFTNGVLKIPCLKLYDTTESFFRNLMAFEQFYHRLDGYVTEYVHVLDCLIDTTKDVDLLVKKGILINCLGESNAVTTLVNNLCKQIFVLETNSYYYDLCKALNTFYDDPWHRWKATLRHDYFSTPWRIASTAAAFILLGLTLIQTVRSFY